MWLVVMEDMSEVSYKLFLKESRAINYIRENYVKNPTDEKNFIEGCELSFGGKIYWYLGECYIELIELEIEDE